MLQTGSGWPARCGHHFSQVTIPTQALPRKSSHSTLTACAASCRFQHCCQCMKHACRCATRFQCCRQPAIRLRQKWCMPNCVCHVWCAESALVLSTSEYVPVVGLASLALAMYSCCSHAGMSCSNCAVLLFAVACQAGAMCCDVVVITADAATPLHQAGGTELVGAAAHGHRLGAPVAALGSMSWGCGGGCCGDATERLQPTVCDDADTTHLRCPPAPGASAAASPERQPVPGHCCAGSGTLPHACACGFVGGHIAVCITRCCSSAPAAAAASGCTDCFQRCSAADGTFTPGGGTCDHVDCTAGAAGALCSIAWGCKDCCQLCSGAGATCTPGGGACVHVVVGAPGVSPIDTSSASRRWACVPAP